MEYTLIQEVSFYFFCTTFFLYGLSFAGIKSLSQYKAILGPLSGVGLLMGFAAYCEFGNFFEKQIKHYERDSFIFVAIIFTIISILSITKTSSSDHPNKNVILLSREQTEEWKGWMQFFFLMYHYFDAKEVYNPIRVLVSSYAFLTGYGNFIYFYKTKDFSFQRFIFMMWRLNFLTIILMCTMNVPYMLYYIVPLHTFYFTMTYVIMGIKSSWNDDRWKLSLKIIISYFIIWFIWDGPISEDLYENLFFPIRLILSMDSSLHEWHFRSYLDHYSTLYGIMFAFHIPQLSKFFYFCESKSFFKQWFLKGVILALLSFVFFEWFFKILLMENRFEYNQFHPYFVIIPLIFYTYIRNISITFRSYHSKVCQIFGGLTLETYLMQYHIFLSDHTKTLLTFIPSYSLSNLVFTFSLLCFYAFYLFHWTMDLRNPICKFSSLYDFFNRVGNFMVIIAFFMIIATFCDPFFGLIICLLLVALILFVFKNSNVSTLFSPSKFNNRINNKSTSNV